MQPFRYHVLVCDQKKSEGVPCCAAHGSAKVIDALRRELGSRGLADTIQVTTTGSLGLCENGPNMVVYPDGVWYSGVQARDVPEIVQSHFVEGNPVQRLMRADPEQVKSEVLANRNRYLASMKARDVAGMLPEALDDTIRGFQSSRVILSALELDIFTVVGNGATAAQVANKVSANERATEMLMNALVGMDLLKKSGDMFTNTATSSRYFRQGSQDDQRMALMHTAHLWNTWSTLTDCVRTGTSVTAGKGRPREEFWTRAFIAAMHRNARVLAPQVAKVVGLDGVARMIDLGGGSGAYSIAFAEAAPHLRVDILDLADVLPLTEQYVSEAGLQDRISFIPGNLRNDSFGHGYDLALLSAICHMFSPEQNQDLFRRAYEALAGGGRLVIRDFVLNAEKTAPRAGTLFALNMLVGTEAGDTYSEQEYTEWLTNAGFREVQYAALPGMASLMIARK